MHSTNPPTKEASQLLCFWHCGAAATCLGLVITLVVDVKSFGGLRTACTPQNAEELVFLHVALDSANLPRIRSFDFQVSIYVSLANVDVEVLDVEILVQPVLGALAPLRYNNGQHASTTALRTMAAAR